MVPALHDGKPIPKGALTFSILPDSLLAIETWLAITEQSRVLGARFVIFDTLSSLASDADETKDAAVIICRLTDLAAAIDGTAILLHDPGWSSDGRAQGRFATGMQRRRDAAARLGDRRRAPGVRNAAEEGQER